MSSSKSLIGICDAVLAAARMLLQVCLHSWEVRLQLWTGEGCHVGMADSQIGDACCKITTGLDGSSTCAD